MVIRQRKIKDLKTIMEYIKKNETEEETDVQHYSGVRDLTVGSEEA